jgi:peptide chain release factor 1
MATDVESNPVLRKLGELHARFQQIEEEMNRPEVAADPNRIVRLAKEHGQLRRMMEPYAEYRRLAAAALENQAILADPQGDPELKELAREELAGSEPRAAELLAAMQKALVTSEDAAIDSVIMEIRAGTGGDEAALFARDLYEMYLRFCERRHYSLEVMDSSPSELGGFKEVILNIKGPGVFQQLGYEGGGHRVQRVPETETQGRIHTSAATVAVLPEPEEVDVQINWEKDVIEHVSRAGGPGGQNVNKVSSAIKLEHIPTGITVSMREEKSQHKNRAKARRVLISRVYDQIVQGQRSARDASRKNMIGSGDRSQRIRTYNFPQNRCTDHRINLDLYSLDKLMQGDLDELFAALQAYDLQQRINAL